MTWWTTWCAVEPSSSDALLDPLWPTTTVTSSANSPARSASARPAGPGTRRAADPCIGLLGEHAGEEVLRHLLERQRVDRRRADGGALESGDHRDVPPMDGHDRLVGSGDCSRPLQRSERVLGSVDTDEVRGHRLRPCHNRHAHRHLLFTRVTRQGDPARPRLTAPRSHSGGHGMRSRRSTGAWAALAVTAVAVAVATPSPAGADTTPQTLPFAQDWTNAGLIATDDDWAGVPGVIGYRGDGLASTGRRPADRSSQTGRRSSTSPPTRPTPTRSAPVAWPSSPSPIPSSPCRARARPTRRTSS